MNDIYGSDYFNPGFSYEPYPVNSQNLYCDYSASHDNRSSYSSSSENCSDTRKDTFFTPNEGFAKGNMQANIYEPYKLKNPGLPPIYNERQRLLLEVQKYGFAMWDLNLYLNTHPSDRNVMKLFDQYRTSYKKACNDYENKYGALKVDKTDTNSGYWPWNKSPWPWEGE